MGDAKGQTPVMHQKDLMIEKCEEIKFVESVDDEYLGKLSLYRLHPYVKYIASKQIPTQYIPHFQKRIQWKHPHLFFYIKKAHQTQKQSGQSFTVFFEHNYFSLQAMVSRRKDNGWHYPETELWTLIKEVTAGLKFLMDNNCSHGDIKKSSIFFDDEYLLYRIYDNQLINSDKYFQYQKNNQNVIVSNGTPPPEFNSYEFSQFKNTYKSDVWNFGIILLECATLQNVPELIYSNGILKIDQLNVLLQSLTTKYSTSFVNCILKILDPDPRTRVDWQQLNKILYSEPLAQQPPPYQVEPTQLHPSRSLRNLHEIVVGAPSQISSSQKENLFQPQTTEKKKNQAIISSETASHQWNYMQTIKTEDFKLDDKGNGKVETQTVKESDQTIEDPKSSTLPSSASNQAVNQRLILLNKKIQDTLTQSKKQTVKLSQNGPR